MSRSARGLSFGLLMFIATGCVRSAMRPVDPAQAMVPSAEKAVVVFGRPGRFFGGAIQSSVFDITQPANHTDKLVGIVSSGTRVAYDTDPGEHLFMVIGENADFMQATLAPGRTYYALVTVRPGHWKARFSLEPIRGGSDQVEDVNDLDLVENSDESLAWAKDNWESIQDKKVDYLRKWNAKPQAERDEQTLRITDGQ